MFKSRTLGNMFSLRGVLSSRVLTESLHGTIRKIWLTTGPEGSPDDLVLEVPPSRGPKNINIFQGDVLKLLV